MKISSYAWMLGLLAWAAGSASAQSMNKDTDYYGELGYLPLSIGVGAISLKPKLARFTVGKNVHQNLAVEATYADTVSKGNYYGLEISSHGYGMALKPKMTIANETEVFARLGWAHTAIKVADTGVSATNSGSSTIYGLGIQTALSKDFYAQVDYMNYYRKNDITAKGWTVSVGMRF
jgi:Outer membrane protein beta-barrel domain